MPEKSLKLIDSSSLLLYHTGIISELEEKLKKITHQLQDAIARLKTVEGENAEDGLWLTVISIKHVLLA